MTRWHCTPVPRPTPPPARAPRVWILQTRYLAHHGWNVLAVDLPGHCRSAGQPPASVEGAADFVIALMDAAGLAKAVLVGHSLGSLIVLEAAARVPGRVSQLVLVGAAFPMKVSPALLAASQSEPMKALEMVNVFSRSQPWRRRPRRWGRAPGFMAHRWHWGAGCWPATRRSTSFIPVLRPATATPMARRQWRK
ncbi:MAG: alpha/beta fold hydrolase [Rhodoferax sp.]